MYDENKNQEESWCVFTDEDNEVSEKQCFSKNSDMLKYFHKTHLDKQVFDTAYKSNQMLM